MFKINFSMLITFCSLLFLSSPARAEISEGLVAHINFEGDNFSAQPVLGLNGAYLTFQDRSGNQSHATCYRSVILGGMTYPMDQCPSMTTGPNGDGDRAAEFFGRLCDVQSDHLGIAKTAAVSNLSRGSFALWVLYHEKMLADGVLQSSSRATYLLDTFKHGAPGTWGLFRYGLSNILAMNNSSGIARQVLVFPDAQLYSRQFETWNHYAITWDGSLIRGYFNGIEFQAVPQTGITEFNLGTYLTIGALNHSTTRNSLDHNCNNQYCCQDPLDPTCTKNKYCDSDDTFVQPNAGFLNGKLDDIRLYNRTLSAAEVAQLAQAINRRVSKLVKVQKQGGGDGLVKASIYGINCGRQCAEAYNPGTAFYLTAAPRGDSVFSGWSGPCSGTGRCNITANEDLTLVTANFSRIVEDVVTIEAESGALRTPLVAHPDGFIWQPSFSSTTISSGGRAEYVFHLDRPSEVLVVGKLNCFSSGSDSFFVNIDSVPEASCDPNIQGDPCMIWDIFSTVGFEERVARWRGDSPNDTDEIDPKWWTLGAGAHRLIFVGREGRTMLDSVRIVRKIEQPLSVPMSPTNLRLQP